MPYLFLKFVGIFVKIESYSNLFLLILGSPFPSAASPLAVGSPGMGPRPSPRGAGPLPSPHSGSGGQSSQTGNRNQVPASRLLPQRLWAGATPTPLTAKALDDICKPSTPPPTPNGHRPPLGPALELSPLHRFLGCVYLRRFMQNHIKTEQGLTGLQSPEPGMIMLPLET